MGKGEWVEKGRGEVEKKEERGRADGEVEG